MKHIAELIAGVIIGVIAIANLSFAQDLCTNPVDTEQGKISGLAEKKLPVCVYKGVPYAAPPVGKLRWRPPEAPARRSEVLKADRFSAECIQGASDYPGVKKSPRSEDCLYLNIWRPQKSGAFPVMLWIHGGSLTSGSGIVPIYWGDRMAAEKDVVVVTINYRLGLYGFLAQRDLSKEDSVHSSGNYGLLDQIESLKWVKANIASFGGDPNNVTIFGESAGGWSVCNLLASPLAKDLFSKAVIESGGCDATATMEEGFKVGDGIVKDIGCQGADTLYCLRNKSVEQITLGLDAAKKQKLEEKKAKGGKSKKNNLLDRDEPQFKWVPHIDGWVLKETPIDALRSGRFNQVPLMVGSNKDEAKLFTMAMPGVRSLPKSTLNKMMVDNLGEEIASDIEKSYPYQDYRKPADAVIDAIGDFALGCKCYEAAKSVSTFKPVYYYRFDYKKHLLPNMAGAAHSLEIPFVFDSLDRPPASLVFAASQRNSAKKLVDSVESYWTNFAKTGDPNGQGLTAWPKYDQDKKLRIIFDLPLRVEPTDFVEKCEYWKDHDIFKK